MKMTRRTISSKHFTRNYLKNYCNFCQFFARKCIYCNVNGTEERRVRLTLTINLCLFIMKIMFFTNRNILQPFVFLEQWLHACLALHCVALLFTGQSSPYTTDIIQLLTRPYNLICKPDMKNKMPTDNLELRFYRIQLTEYSNKYIKSLSNENSLNVLNLTFEMRIKDSQLVEKVM